MNNFGDLARFHTPSDKIAITYLTDYQNPKCYSYNTLQVQVEKVAHFIVEQNLPSDARIGIIAKNSALYLSLFLGIMTAGRVVVPINTKLKRNTVEYICSNANIRFLFYDADTTDLLPTNVEGVEISGRYRPIFSPGAQELSAPFESHRKNPDDDALFLYTSGSTGKPKGVPMTHGGQYWAVQRSEKNRAYIQSHTCLIAAPLYHKNGLWNAKVVLGMGGHMVLLPEFNARSYLKAIADFQCSWLTSVPTMLALAIREHDLIEQYNFNHVTQVTMGSAPITQSLWDQVQAIFPNATLYNGYGTTEHGAVSFGDHPDGITRPPLSIGYPAPDSEIRLDNKTADNEGVLSVRSPANMKGYHLLEQKTKERMKDDWFNTGDIVQRDKNGFFFIVGRADDMFNCAGENIYPGQIEKILEDHPQIAQACIVPFPYAEKGEAPHAFVVLQTENSVTEDDVKSYVLERAPAYMHPRRVTFLNALPLIGTNKIDRKALIELAVTDHANPLKL